MTKKSSSQQSVFYQGLLHALEQPVIAIDSSGKVVFWNRRSEATFGWTAEEVVGSPIQTLLSSFEPGTVGRYLSEGQTQYSAHLQQKKWHFNSRSHYPIIFPGR